MIILDFRSTTHIYKIEKIKVLLHVLKVCIIFKLELVLQNNTRDIKITIWKTDRSHNPMFIIVMKPETRSDHTVRP